MKQLTLRPIDWTDFAMLRAWRNDPKTRAASKTTGRVGVLRHLLWMRKVLAPGSAWRYYVAELMYDGQKESVGACGFEIEQRPSWVVERPDQTVARVSINVAPWWRMCGLAVPMLTKLVEAARDSGCDMCRAEIRNTNAPSMLVFERAGFKYVTPGIALLAQGGYYTLERPCV